MTPFQFVGFSVDWWALGVLLYEMLAGRSPFDIAGASDIPDQVRNDLGDLQHTFFFGQVYTNEKMFGDYLLIEHRRLSIPSDFGENDSNPTLTECQSSHCIESFPRKEAT